MHLIEARALNPFSTALCPSAGGMPLDNEFFDINDPLANLYTCFAPDLTHYTEIELEWSERRIKT
jgi:hypothetical protein